MNKDLIKKVRGCKNVDELLAAAKEIDYPLDEAGAKELFDTMHQSGELSDSELDAVAGGGCQTDVGGEEYTIVTSGLQCFTGKYQNNLGPDGNFIVRDNPSLRQAWLIGATVGQMCGSCQNLAFKNGLGYCEVENK